MSHPRRVIVESAKAQQLITLNDSESHYLKNVLRLTSGAAVTVVSKVDGVMFDAFIAAQEPSVQLQLLEASQHRTAKSIVQTLFLPLLKGTHTDLVVEKCCELGVANFAVFEAQRSVAKLQTRSENSRQSRLDKVALAAARQCGRAEIPKISLYASLADALEKHPKSTPLLWCSLDSSAKPIAALAPLIQSLSLVIGPEGDLTPAETALILERGGIAITLGAMLLRSETAAIAAVAMLHANSPAALGQEINR